MKRVLLCVGLSILLSACVPTEPELERTDVGPHQERTMLNALERIKPSDEQRVAVLNAYDASNSRLRELSAQSRQIVTKWHQLNRLAPDFQDQVDALSLRWAEVNAQEMKTRAAYERSVALAITPKQWQQWQDFMNSQPPTRDDYGDRVRR